MARRGRRTRWRPRPPPPLDAVGWKPRQKYVVILRRGHGDMYQRSISTRRTYEEAKQHMLANLPYWSSGEIIEEAA